MFIQNKDLEMFKRIQLGSEDYCRNMVGLLNEDIASIYILFLQVKKQHVIVKGLDWKHIHDIVGEYAT